VIEMASQKSGLTDNQQGILVFIVLALPTIGAWAAAGFPTSKLALGAVVAALIASVGLAIKEIMGTSAPTTAPAPTTPAVSTPQAATPLPLFRLMRRLIFLQLRK
jgi:hypothetical protein